MNEKFNTANLRRVIANPILLYGEISKQLIELNSFLHSYGYHGNRGDGPVDVMEADWDNLIILDGCRYDTFEKKNNIEGVLQKKISPGSQSLEYLRESFSNRSLHDTIYISANPFVPELNDSIFHEVVSLLGNWDQRQQTVMPESVVEETRNVIERKPHKRLIVHFMQPHYPFIGPKGQSLEHRGYRPDEEDRRQSLSVWDELQYRTADFDLSDAIDAYEENLEIVLRYVAQLLQSINGKTVITSDHGNLLGERTAPIPVQGFGHPRGLRTPELVEVPWLTIHGDRREVTSEAPISNEYVNEDAISDRLNALGYVE